MTRKMAVAVQKPLPRQGEFCKVFTSVRPNEVGYCSERTGDTVTVEFKGGVVGKYSIDKNEFARIHVFPGPKWSSMSIDERIDILSKTTVAPRVIGAPKGAEVELVDGPAW